MGQEMVIRWVNSCEEIAGDLWAEVFPSPLEGKWWYRALERSGLEDQFKFSYAIVEEAGVAVGIAPCFLADVPMELVAPPAVAWMLRQVGRVMPGVKYQRTFFIGSPCADEGTVGLRRGILLKDAAAMIQRAAAEQARRAGASMIVWKDFGSEFEADAKILVEQEGMFEAVSYPGTRVAIPAGGFEKYLQSIGSSHRHHLKKKIRRGEAVGALGASVIRNPDPGTLAEIFGLFWQTYEKGKTKFEKLNPRFFEEIAGCDEAHWVLLRHGGDGRLAAFMLCFLLGNRAINKFIGLDYRLEGDWYLYFRLWREAVEWASKNGASEIQSGQTGYRAKLDLEHALVPLTNYCRHRNAIFNWVFARVARGIRWETLDGDLKVFKSSRRQGGGK